MPELGACSGTIPERKGTREAEGTVAEERGRAGEVGVTAEVGKVGLR